MTTSTTLNATGRRKKSTARLHAVAGSGKITVNGKSVEDYFKGHVRQKDAIFKPLKVTPVLNSYDIDITATGGGVTGQSAAIILALARACKKLNPEAGKLLRKEGLLTRDPRMVERKKAGRPKARKRFQFSKR